jgi:CubicO group peptidase (beta-lactamase class C family)
MFNHDWWFRDAAGRYLGGWGLRLRPMDMLKLGQLYIQKGVWNERQVFDARYPAMATTPGASSRYGLHWWIALPSGNTAPDFFAAIGFKGQRLYVFPDLGIVVAIVSSLTGDEETQLTVATLEAIRASVPRFWARSASDAVRAELSQLVQSGFRGVKRVRQSSQDVPKAPQKAP